MKIIPALNGSDSLLVGDEWIDDPADPEKAASEFAPESKVREASTVLLVGPGLGYRAAWLRSIRPDAVVYEPDEEMRALAEARGCPCVPTETMLREALLREGVVGAHRLLVLYLPAYARAFPDVIRSVHALVHEVETVRRVRINTIKVRFAAIVEGGLGNLDELERHPLYTQLGQPLAGRPAFIVCAGPSLDKNGHLLREAQKRGPVFCVGTSAGACHHHGVTPDVLVSIETIDKSDTMRKAAARLEALDLTVHRSSFDATDAPKVMFTPAGDPWASLNAKLGAQCLEYGASVSTAAWHLAVRWGADPVVFVGQDLAWTDGRMYGAGTGREHWTCSFDGQAVQFDYPEEHLQSFRDRGIEAPESRHPAFPRPAWGGNGSVVVTHDLLLFARWLEIHVVKYATRSINATEGGLHVDGFEDRALADVLAELPEREPVDWALPEPNASGLREWRSNVKATTKRFLTSTRECLRARNPQQFLRFGQKWERIQPHADVAVTHAQPRLIEIFEKKMGDAAQNMEALKAFATSAQRVLEVLR